MRSNILTFPPPPTSSNSSSKNNHNRVRSSSKNHTDRLLSSLGSRARNTSTPPAVNAIDALQEITAQALAQAPEPPQPDSSLRAPASRRAASTGAIGVNGPLRGLNQSFDRHLWEPGMPLPPPPPGPPPTVRSQSMSRSSDFSPVSDREYIAAPRTRRPPVQGTSLETVPPTPAEWREGESNNHGSWPNRVIGTFPLHIDTSRAEHSDHTAEHYPPSAIVADDPRPFHTRRDSVNGGLIRSPAVRNRSSKGIRERRSESKSGKGRVPEDLSAFSTADLWGASGNNAPTVDLDRPLSENSLSRRQATTQSTPMRSNSICDLDGPSDSADGQLLSGEASFDELRYSTPRPESTRSNHLSKPITPTTPFSPGSDNFPKPSSNTHTSPTLPPKPWFLSPQRRQSEVCNASFLDAPHATQDRPVSHLLHSLTSDVSIPAPLVPSNVRIDRPVPGLLGPESPSEFAKRAVERHRNFAEDEAALSTDAERLVLFTQFVVAESRIRRERYALVFDEENINIDELTQGMFELSSAGVKAGETERGLIVEQALQASDQQVSRTTSHTSQKSATFTTASQDADSPMSSTSNPHSRPESTWWNEYVPCLSPIASMSIVTGQDEMDSRGRAPSRWWESASCDSVSADAFKVLERSKRESKYMGLPRESRKPSCSHYDKDISTSVGHKEESEAVPSQRSQYGPDEFPPEKTGWHEEMPTVSPRAAHPPTPPSALYTPSPRKLDISRLVTLPPPYPRHHPAVNNSHPDLSEIRTIIRSLGNISEADLARQSHKSQILELRQSNDSWRKHLRSRHKQDMRQRMARDEISQEEFDRAEAAIKSEELEAEKDIVQSDFDLFQTNVVSPVHALFSAHISKATASFDRLSSRLFNDAQLQSPNLPQEEGDEQPELLEKLTQLKWLFEAREALHRETYDLLSERNEKYKVIVVLPYHQSHNTDKVAEAESFFARDSHDRKLAFEKDALVRYSAFLDIIESNVVRGVEAQLSAFWDIAPSLLKLLQQIPQDLYGFEIQIPWQEYVENPSYHEHALQYLFSLLEHAEKSSYQFIESQINLLCLLHGTKEACLAAEGKVKRMQVEGRTVDEEMRAEERRLTDDLKEKVGVVEGLWEEGLGAELRGVRERVRGWLVGTGGWDEDGEEG